MFCKWVPHHSTHTALPTHTLGQAYDCVGDPAVSIACHIIARMLQHTTPDVCARLCACGTKLGIIGRHQVTTDIPEHTFLKLSKGEQMLKRVTECHHKAVLCMQIEGITQIRCFTLAFHCVTCVVATVHVQEGVIWTLLHEDWEGRLAAP